MKRRLTDLNRYVRGWVGYFGLARQFNDIAKLDGWIRRRQWRQPLTAGKANHYSPPDAREGRLSQVNLIGLRWL